MKYYFAPLEGVTGYIYRNAHQTFFGQIDKYFTPFISPTSNKGFTSRELNDILPEHNHVIDKQVIKAFHDAVYAGYQEILSGDRNVLFKMKEFWFYMMHLFSESDKYAKKIRKADRLRDYEAVISRLFQELDIEETLLRGF